MLLSFKKEDFSFSKEKETVARILMRDLRQAGKTPHQDAGYSLGCVRHCVEVCGGTRRVQGLNFMYDARAYFSLADWVLQWSIIFGVEFLIALSTYGFFVLLRLAIRAKRSPRYLIGFAGTAGAILAPTPLMVKEMLEPSPLPWDITFFFLIFRIPFFLTLLVVVLALD